MENEEQFLQNLYTAFNRREIEKILSAMRPDVAWANGMEGGFVYGRDNVREYWLKQFETMLSELEPLSFEIDDDDRRIVAVRIKIHDPAGNLLLEKTVRQIFTFEDGLISKFEIDQTEPVQKTLRELASSGQNSSEI